MDFVLKYMRVLMAVLVFLSTSTVSIAQEEMTWAECVRQTLANHPKLLAAIQNVESSMADKRIAISDALPQINGNASYRHTIVSKNTSKSASYGLDGRLLLFNGLQTANQVKAADKNIEADRFAFNVVASDLLLTLRTAFIDVLESQQLIQLTEDIVKRRQQNVDLVKLRYEGGREHVGALLTAQADLSQANFEVSQSKRALDLARRELLIAMGTREVKDINVNGGFTLADNYDQKPDINSLTEQIPFVRQLIAAKESADFSAKAAKGSFFPEISALAGADRSGEDFRGDAHAMFVGLSVSLPIFEGGRNIAQSKKSHVQFLKAEANEENGRNQVIVLLEQAWKDLQDAKEIVAVREKFTQAAEERAKIARAQYGTGLIGFDAWIIIENNLVSAQKAFLSAQANVLIAQANWIHALGGTLNETAF